MKNYRNSNKAICMLSVFILIFIPIILKIPTIKSILSWWLDFSDDSSYKNTYIELLGNIIAVFISVLGALRTEYYLRNKEEQKMKSECIRSLHGELNRCFRTLKDIYMSTKIKNKISKIESKDIDSFCEIATLHQLNLNNEWISLLAQLNGLISTFDWNNLQKFFSRLSVIDQAINSGDKEKIKSVYIQYICWFITSDGDGLHSDIESFMKRLENMFSEN